MSNLQMHSINRRWGIDPLTGKIDQELAIHEMCDTGAKAVLAGHYDAIRFDIMPMEKEPIKKYMAEKWPDVPYSLRYPSLKGL